MNNNTTSQPNTQDQMGGLSPDQIMSSLAFTTHLHEQSLPRDVSTNNTPQNTQNAPQSQEGTGNEESPEDKKMMDLEGKIDKKLEILRDELKGNQKVEIDSLRQDIKDILSNEQD